MALLPSLLWTACGEPHHPGQGSSKRTPEGDTIAGNLESVVKYVEVDGRRLAYMSLGKGQPVLLVHGGSGDMRVWGNQLKAFSTKYRVIAISCRGYYPSEALHPHDTLALDTFVHDLTGFIRSLNLGPVHLVGHSSPGGFASLLLARRHPELLRSVVLIEPPAFPLLGVSIPPRFSQIAGLMFRQPRVAIGFLKFGAKGLRPALHAFQNGDDSEGLRLFMRANLGTPFFNQLSASRFDQAMENIEPLKAQIRAGFPQFSAADARNIQVPTLLVSGEKSNVLLHAVTDTLSKLIPDVESITIKSASHNMFETHPQAFNSAVMDFLDRHRGETAH